MNTTTPSATIAELINADPRVQELARARSDFATRLEDTHIAKRRLVERQQSLNTATALITLGHATEDEVSAKRSELDGEVAATEAEIVRLTTALGQLDQDYRGACRQVREEVKTRLQVEAQDAVRAAARAFEDMERAAAQLSAYRQRGVDVPAIPIYVAQEWAPKFRASIGGGR